MKTCRIVGKCFTKPPQYMLEDNPFDFMTEFDKWFWFCKRCILEKNYWFWETEIPIERCGWKKELI